MGEKVEYFIGKERSYLGFIVLPKRESIAFQIYDAIPFIYFTELNTSSFSLYIRIENKLRKCIYSRQQNQKFKIQLIQWSLSVLKNECFPLKFILLKPFSITILNLRIRVLLRVIGGVSERVSDHEHKRNILIVSNYVFASVSIFSEFCKNWLDATK